MNDPDCIADMAIRIARVLNTVRWTGTTYAPATNLEATAALATVLSIRLHGQSAKARAEYCRWFTQAVLCAGQTCSPPQWQDTAP